MIEYNSNLKPFAKELRKNMTDAERKLWSRLRSKQLKGLKFVRQKMIGDYIVDFYCHEAKVVIEVDGSQHYTESGLFEDCIRDEFLESNDLRVFRFNNIDVLKNTEGVMEYLFNNI